MQDVDTLPDRPATLNASQMPAIAHHTNPPDTISKANQTLLIFPSPPQRSQRTASRTVAQFRVDPLKTTTPQFLSHMAWTPPPLHTLEIYIYISDSNHLNSTLATARP